MRSRSFVATPPGATIKELINDRGLSQKEFAIRMDLSEKHISKLINGDVRLTPEMAVKLEVVLGVPAKFWNNLEAIYREKIIKARAENEMEADETLAKQLPYNEMSKYGWIPETRDSKERVSHLRRYFEVVNLYLLENNQVNRIACRRLAITEKSDLAFLAWIQEAKIMAREKEIAPISVKALISAVPEIRKMTMQNPTEFCPKLEEILAGCGVALIFLPNLKGSLLHGATFLDGKKIVIGLTARGEGADEFWFSLFHEIGHIILGHLNKPEGITNQDEENADAWSRDTLIPNDKYCEFLQGKKYSRDLICKFADSIGIAPGIVVARLQKDNILNYNTLNELKEHYAIGE